jgi:hypothetical protein
VSSAAGDPLVRFVADALTRVDGGESVFLPITPSMSRSAILACIDRSAAERSVRVDVTQAPGGVYLVPGDDG